MTFFSHEILESLKKREAEMSSSKKAEFTDLKHVAQALLNHAESGLGTNRAAARAAEVATLRTRQ